MKEYEKTMQDERYIIAKLLAYRKKIGFSQVRIAKVIGVTRLTILRWENGQYTNIRRCNLINVERLLKLKRCRTCGKIL